MANGPRKGLKAKIRGLPSASWPAALVFVVVLVAWQLTTSYGPWPHYLFPTPMAVASAIKRLALSGDLGAAVSATVRRLAVGFSIAILIGTILSFSMVRFPTLKLGVKPYLLGFQSLPSLAWIPLAIIWFGLNESALIFVTVIGSVFSVAIVFTDALGSVRPAHLLAARNMGSKGLNLIVRVMIPAALPPIVSGAKQCWSFAWRSLVGAELIFTFVKVSLGHLLVSAREFGDIAQVFAVMLATLLVGLLFEVFFFSNVETWIKRRWGLIQG